MSEQEIKKVIAETTKIVEQWPPWKQNVLNYSAQPTRSTPRPLIEATQSAPENPPASKTCDESNNSAEGI